jgi:phytoene desaturase
MRGAIEQYVKSPQLRQLLSRFATYVGGDPFQAPATLNVIAHVELNEGVWYPRGGIYQIAAGLVRLAEELGVEIRLNQRVNAIRVQNDTIVGVALMNGSNIDTRYVISNVDVTTTFRHLLPPVKSVQKRLAQLARYSPSCSGFLILLGIEGKDQRLAHHNIFFSEDYRAEFKAIFQHHLPAENPTIYVAITSKTDANHAPENRENWFILVNAPALSEKFDWKTEAVSYSNRIMETLAQRGFDIRDRIQVEYVFTPEDLQQMTGAWRGALYGPSPNNRWAAFRRPHNRSSILKGLYFTGGTTHPGGGVPMVTLSGKVTAELVLQDLIKSKRFQV